MTGHRLFDTHFGKTWKYALIGGIASIPLTLFRYWMSGMGNDFPLGMVFVGGLLAGALAERNSAGVARAGIGAGVIGGIPGFVWILPAISSTAADFASAWSFSPIWFVGSVIFAGIVVGMSALVGLLGGVAGGWLTTKIRHRRTTDAID